jgi:O-antigen/teichoic acid export membrane protein
MTDEEKRAFFNEQFKNLRITSAFLFPIIAFIAFRARDILPFFFGKGAEPVILPFQIIIWSVILIFYSFMILRIAIFIDKKSTVLVALALEALSLGVLCFYLTSLYGLEGTATAALISTAVLFVFTVLSLTSAGIKMPLYRSGEKPAIAAMGLMVILHYVASMSFPLIFVISFAAYLAIFIIISWLEKGIAGNT